MRALNKKRRPRVLILSGVIPATNRGGGCLALHRHFTIRDDFEVLVAGSSLDGCSSEEILELPQSRIIHRLRRTCLSRLVCNVEFLINWYRLPRGLEQAARKWNPDVIFTVPDNSHSGWASQLAKRLGIPLATNFQDLFPLSRFLSLNNKPYKWVSRFLMRRFHQLHHQADLVFYTSEGMRDWFGSHRHGHVLYPMGAQVEVAEPKEYRPGHRAVLLYAGNCYGAYGRMLLRLADQLAASTTIDFRIFAAGNDWSDGDVERLQAVGIYRGFVPFEDLQAELDVADAFLTVMGFEPEERPFVQTSFTTKWLDYAPCAKPVFVWAPGYSSAAVFAAEHKCGIVVDIDAPDELVRRLEATMSSPDAARQASKASAAVAYGCLSAESIHQTFKVELERTVTEKS